MIFFLLFLGWIVGCSAYYMEDSMNKEWDLESHRRLADGCLKTTQT